MKLFRDLMMSTGMADTRAQSLAEAVDRLHASVSAMDDYNLAVFRSAFPGTIDMLNAYGDREQLRTFRDKNEYDAL